MLARAFVILAAVFTLMLSAGISPAHARDALNVRSCVETVGKQHLAVFAVQWTGRTLKLDRQSSRIRGGKVQGRRPARIRRVDDDRFLVVKFSRSSRKVTWTLFGTRMPVKLSGTPCKPRMLTAPKLTGTTEVGQTLGAQRGDVSGDPTRFRYRWQYRPAGERWKTITYSDGPVLELTDALEGAHVRVAAAAANKAGWGPYRTSRKVGPVTAADPDDGGPTDDGGNDSGQGGSGGGNGGGNGGGQNPATPSLVTAPLITGTLQHNSSLTVGPGAWTGSPGYFEFQWERSTGAGFSAIDGATAASYQLTAADVGAVLRARVTAYNAAGHAAVYTTPTAAVLPLPPSKITTPKVIVDRAAVGRTFSTDNGAWANSPTHFSYQWMRCTAGGGGCSAIAGATGAAYQATGADLGRYLRVDVTAHNAAGEGVVLSSATAALIGRYPAQMKDLSAGLVGWWRLGDTGGPAQQEVSDAYRAADLDVSGTVQYGTAGLISGDPDTSAVLPAAGYLYDDGAADGSQHPYPFGGRAPFTALAWVDLSKTDPTANLMGSYHCGGGQPWGWSLMRAGGAFHGYRLTAGVRGQVSTPAIDGGTHMVAVTYDGTTMRMYMDNYQFGTATSTDSIIATTGPFKLGGVTVCAATAGRAAIDEPALWNRALGGQEILELFYAGVNG